MLQYVATPDFGFELLFIAALLTASKCPMLIYN